MQAQVNYEFIARDLRIYQTCVSLEEGMRPAKDAYESSTRINALEKDNLVFAWSSNRDEKKNVLRLQKLNLGPMLQC